MSRHADRAPPIRTCPLCEAGCGLEITLRAATEVVRIRGDRDDVFSHGYICPKGSTLKQLHEDPDRLRRPLVKRDGALVEVDLGRGVRRDRAAAAAGPRRARPRRAWPSTSATRTPTTSPRCSTAGRCSGRSAPRNVFSASTVDQRPKEIVVGAACSAAA